MDLFLKYKIIHRSHNSPVYYLRKGYFFGQRFDVFLKFPSMVINVLMFVKTPCKNCFSLVTPRPYITMEYSDVVFVRIMY
jgi:hypothetical protein